MYKIALRIRTRDWLYTLLIGVVFAMLLSSLGYALLERSWLQGALYGALLGFAITLFSLIFITFMNQTLLPRLRKFYWLPLAAGFSFLSGFLGTLVSRYLADFLNIALIPKFHSDIVKISVAIGLLTYIVGALLYRFVKMRNEKEEVDHHYVESRLRSLERQLNPHFLFNALNSVAELIHQDPDKAEESVLKISSFLRSSMDEKALLPLKDELRNVRQYIELENIRFSGRITLHLQDAPPSWRVPKFSIQLLAENAIKHGLGDAKTGLSITVTFDTERQCIRVKNDGKAMRSTAFGIGLNNLNQRLQLLCRGRLEVVATEEPTFCIYVKDCHENTDR